MYCSASGTARPWNWQYNRRCPDQGRTHKKSLIFREATMKETKLETIIRMTKVLNQFKERHPGIIDIGVTGVDTFFETVGKDLPSFLGEEERGTPQGRLRRVHPYQVFRDAEKETGLPVYLGVPVQRQGRGCHHWRSPGHARSMHHPRQQGRGRVPGEHLHGTPIPGLQPYRVADLSR